MIYRTHHQPSLYDLLLSDLEEFHEKTSEFELDYYEKSDLERYLMPLSSFFYRISYEVSGTNVHVEKSNRYVFIGTFWQKFHDTSYIADRGYKDDIDVCRHFGVDMIYIYYYEGFVSRYDKDELSELITHVNQHEQWILELPSWHLQREIFLGVFTTTFDRFLFC
jgi:hypothetical protein